MVFIFFLIYNFLYFKFFCNKYEFSFIIKIFLKISVTFIVNHGCYLKFLKAVDLRFSFSSCLHIFRDPESLRIWEGSSGPTPSLKHKSPVALCVPTFHSTNRKFTPQGSHLWGVLLFRKLFLILSKNMFP